MSGPQTPTADLTPRARARRRSAVAGPTPAELAAKTRQAAIDATRKQAELIAELAETIHNGGSQRALRHYITTSPPGLGPLAAQLRAAVDGSPDRRALAATLDDIATRAGLTKVGADSARFDVHTQKPIAGTSIRQGAPVIVLRPGYAADINGERVTLMKADVQEWDDQADADRILAEWGNSPEPLADSVPGVPVPPAVVSDLTPLDRIALAELSGRGTVPLSRLRRVYGEQTQAEQDTAIARLRNAGLIAVDGRTVTLTGKGGWLDASNRAPAPDVDSALTRLDRPRRSRNDEPVTSGRRMPGTGTGVPAAPVAPEPMNPRSRPRLRGLERRVFASLIRQSGDRTGTTTTTVQRLLTGMPDTDPAEIRRILDQLVERGQIRIDGDQVELTAAGRTRWDAPRRTRLGVPQPNMDEIRLPARQRFADPVFDRFTQIEEAAGGGGWVLAAARTAARNARDRFMSGDNPAAIASDLRLAADQLERQAQQAGIPEDEMDGPVRPAATRTAAAVQEAAILRRMAEQIGLPARQRFNGGSR